MGHLERGRNLKLLQAARESIFPIYLAFFCISDRSKKIRGSRTAQIAVRHEEQQHEDRREDDRIHGTARKNKNQERPQQCRF